MMSGAISRALSFLQHNPWVLWAALGALVLAVVYRRDLHEGWQLWRRNPKEWFKQFWKNWGEPFLWAALLAVVIRTFLLGPYKIPTGSMRTTFLEGDRIFVDKISYRFKAPKRGDIIVFKFPGSEKKDFVKRLVGLSGEEIEIRDGKVLLNGAVLNDPPFSHHYYYNREEWNYGKTGQVIKVPAGSYFVLGDNSAQSSDSRNWGFVPGKNLIGKAFFIWWPPKRAKLVE